MVGILKEKNAEFGSFNILMDEEVRQGWHDLLTVEHYKHLTCHACHVGLKKFSNWPTYPQLYVNGELVGGLDIIKVKKPLLSMFLKCVIAVQTGNE